MRLQLDQSTLDKQILQNVSAQTDAAISIPKVQRRKAEVPHWTLQGFSGKSKVLTSFGLVPIEMLRLNDPLKTSSGTFLRVCWVDRICLDHEFLSLHPHAQPIHIQAGSLGKLKPPVNMLVSPAQIIETSIHVGNASFKHASELVGRGRISKSQQAAFTYFLFGCEDVCSVCVDGIWCRVLPRSNN